MVIVNPMGKGTSLDSEMIWLRFRLLIVIIQEKFEYNENHSDEDVSRTDSL
jgi:hypothetical protein